MVIERLHQWVRFMLLAAAVCVAIMTFATVAAAKTNYNGAGDLNDDGAIDIEDVRLMIKVLKGEISVDGLTLELVDIAPIADRDLDAKANDLSVLMRAIVIDDFDGDGRDNNVELTADLGENPFLADTDGDGLNDGEEQTYNTKPAVPDTDGDGVLDGDEIANGTDPNLGDSDGDGLLDGFEILYGLNPNEPDSDMDSTNDADEDQDVFEGEVVGDGLTNLEEQAEGSSPLLVDTDGDLLNDKVEVDGTANPPYDSDPADADTDDDGLDDYAESQIPTRPRTADNDNDGLLDGVEVNDANTNPNDSDSDNDGLLDGFEYTYGLDPNEPDTDMDTIDDGDEDEEDEGSGDGLDNLAEQAAGTSPLLSDTDGDMISDGVEFAAGTSPTSADSDGDGFSDTADNCPKNFNPGQEDDDDGFEDGDGIGDVCDNCIFAKNNDQADTDLDGFGDACETSCSAGGTGTDPDRDGRCGNMDNCPNWPNPTQTDTWGLGSVGDACECGDVNNDGQVLATAGDTDPASNDLVAYANHMNSSSRIDIDAAHKCDVDGDGMCTQGDVAMVEDLINNGVPLPNPGLCADYAQVLDHVISRTGYGQNAHSRHMIREIGVTAYIDRQLDPDSINDATIGKILDQYRPGGTTWPTLAPAPQPPAGIPAPAEPAPILNSNYFERALGTDAKRPLHDLSEIKMWRAIHSKRQLEAVMLDLMFDHLNVDGFGGFNDWPRFGIMGYEAGLERHLFGKYEDMVQASAESAAMLSYLDQHRSEAGKINENYARELMELHTVGDGTYDNTTVLAVSEVLTGYMLNTAASWLPLGGLEQDDWVFEHDPDDPRHDQTHKTIVITDGVSPPTPWNFRGASGGPQCGANNDNQGERLICLLTEHPATAKRIAELFVTRFVSEQPEDQALKHPAVLTLIAAAAAEYENTSGDLKATLSVVLHDPLFVKGAYYRGKVKRPFAYMASLFRALGEGAEGGSASRFVGGASGTPAQFNNSFRSVGLNFELLNESPYQADPPIGYEDDSYVSASSGGILIRSNYVKHVMSNWLADWAYIWDFEAAELVNNELLLDKLIDRFFPGGIRRASVGAEQSTHDIVLNSLNTEWGVTPTADSANDRIVHATALLLATPEFLLH